MKHTSKSKNIDPKLDRNCHYVGVKGDEIDIKLAEYVGEFGTPVPWKRLSEGVYMYGTKKVLVKYLRCKLII